MAIKATDATTDVTSLHAGVKHPVATARFGYLSWLTVDACPRSSLVNIAKEGRG